ncbi:YvcK family protein [Patescibacteria group bacterium]|nr:YvcK family protein [Patescibacteria group bacterium]MBU4000062.1 YvcK family protein [Patescibacteria group bacterium]MBU4057053.1 YvcK family protein [Patescibacteria group bacterium]MBU4368898.1 YvcK family protein [Patescibacteria group bacterium]
MKVAKNKVKAIKKFVCFGGGNAVPKLLLESLKKYPVRITGVTSMVDNGGSAGQLREDFNVLPPGDIRRHILALSDAPQWKKDLWVFRFGHEVFDGGHKGHVFANAFIAGLENILKDYGKALDVMHEFMEVSKKHKALPATVEKTQIYAELENGETVKGEDEIDVPIKHDPKLKIKKVFLKPKAKAYPQVLKAIAEADAITIGPGDLYSSSIPCILMEGMADALCKTKAKKIFVVNAMTKLCETNDYSVMDFAKEVEKYMGCPLDYVIYNTEIPNKKRIEEYKKEEPSVIEMVKINPSINSGRAGKKFIGAKILTKEGAIVYDPEKLVKTIMSLI